MNVYYFVIPFIITSRKTRATKTSYHNIFGMILPELYLLEIVVANLWAVAVDSVR